MSTIGLLVRSRLSSHLVSKWICGPLSVFLVGRAAGRRLTGASAKVVASGAELAFGVAGDDNPPHNGVVRFRFLAPSVS